MRSVGSQSLSVRLGSHVTLEPHTSGEIVVHFHGHSFGLGTFSVGMTDRARELGFGVPFSSLEADNRHFDEEMHLLVRRLAMHGLLEYRLGSSPHGRDLVVIEPQVPDYWPRLPRLSDKDTLVLSRFAYMRRRGSEMVLESPRAGALFKIGDPKIARLIASLAKPQAVNSLHKQSGFPGIELLALMIDCQVAFKMRGHSDSGLRLAEGDDDLVLWDFHDLLFHTRSTEGRHANPLGGVYRYARRIPPQPAVRPPWPGKKFNLKRFLTVRRETISPVATLLRQRHSTRVFDNQRPITLDELSRFLEGTAPVLSEGTNKLGFGNDGPAVGYAVRPYPSAGASSELELYLAVDKCEGLRRGFYHYDAGEHGLVSIEVHNNQLEAMLMKAAFAMGVPSPPQILITIAARFGRISWKYSSIAYALILKDVGVLTQTFYLMATDLGLGGCAIGIANIDLFARMTGLRIHVEGPVGQFALGREPQREPNLHS